MMRPTLRLVFALAILAAVAPAADAHSLEETQSMIGQEERYFQPIDKPAPDFTLRTADGRVVRLADFRDKVVVLHFIYTSCPDVCPLHAERIAEIQSMVNQTPMKERVQFITITTDPTRDTLDVMREYGKAHGLDSVNWLFHAGGSAGRHDTAPRGILRPQIYEGGRWLSDAWHRYACHRP